MKIRNKILIGFLALLLVFGIGILYVMITADQMVARAIEKYGSESVKTNVDVSTVDLSFRRGEASISALTVANPEGFQTPYAFSLDDISVNIDTSTILSQPLVVNDIHVRKPVVYYEINTAGESNILELQKNLEKPPTAPTGETKPAEGEEFKLIIRNLVVEDGQLQGKVPGVKDERLTAKIGRIELTGLGAKTNGATPQEIAKEIAAVLVERATVAATEMGIRQYTGKSPEELQQELEKEFEKKLKGIFD